MENRKPYPSDVSDEEWAFVAPYLTLFPLDAGQRKHSLREVFNAVRYVVRCVAHGACCPMICRHGHWFINKCNAG